MQQRKRTARALAAAAMMVAAIGIGAVVGSPGLASAQVDMETTTTSGEIATSSTLVDDTTETTLEDATNDTSIDGTGDEIGARDGQPCDGDPSDSGSES